jgi:hypothetical protein
MKKTLAILALALFIGGISVPAIAVNSNTLTLISLQDEDPKKKAEGEKSEKKATSSKEATKSGDCSSEKKAADCSNEKKTAKASGGCEK